MPNERLKPNAGVLKSPILAALGLMFLTSGAVALIYEAAWQREFTLLFGSSAPAIAAVLAAYFTGLGLGSFFLGKLAGRIRNPIATYGVLELVIGFGALLVTPILSSYARFYPMLATNLGDAGMALPMAKGFLALAAIAVPTLAMGGTLPMLAQIFETRRERFGELAGWFYLVNTAGAAGGVAAFPWVLGALGMKATVAWCAGVNLAIGIVALLLGKTKSPVLPEARETSAEAQARNSGDYRWLVLLAFLSGFVIFVLQVSWNRAFAQVHENSIYSFSAIVAIFIVAITAGAQLARWLLRRRINPRKALGTAWIAGGLATIVAPLLFLKLTDGMKYSAGGALGSGLIGPGSAVIFLPVALLATGLPLILHQAANVSKRASGELTGSVLAGNVAGSVAGALAGGFLFPPTIGLWRTLIVMGGAIAATGSLLHAKTRGGCALGAGVCFLLSGSMLMMELPRTRMDTARGEKLLAIQEGTHGIVAVVERAGSRRLKLNNHYVLGGTAAMGDERMQAHIPLILHGNPRRVVFLGYGTGITAGAVAFHPVEQAVAVELVAEVAELAARFFAAGNQDAAKGAGPRVVIEDGRSFLRGSKEQFDVIIGDLVVPWRHGEGALYSLEQFKIGRSRLATGGIYCAWLPMFQLNREDFELILRTFRSVFPEVSVWRGDFSPTERALALAGSESEHLDARVVARRLGELEADRFNPQLKFERAFWMHFVGIFSARSEPSTGWLNTENRPFVELRRKSLQPFGGRALQLWETDLNRKSFDGLKDKLSDNALKGWEASAAMSEFTQLSIEGREREATAAQQVVRKALGDEAAQSIFGPE